MACKAQLFTSVSINNNKTKLNKGFNSLSLQKGTEINYDVVTTSGKVQKSDKFYFEVISVNLNYINQFLKDKFANASNQKIQEWNSKPIKFEEDVLSKMDSSRLIVINNVQLLKTDSSGRYSGTYKVPSTLNNKLFTINFYYGYSASAEAGTKEKGKEGLIKDILRITTLATLPISGWVAAGLVVTEVTAETLYAYSQVKGNAPAGKNKHGCEFPNGRVIAQTYEINPPKPNPEPKQDGGEPIENIIKEQKVDINSLIFFGGAIVVFVVIGMAF